MSEKPTTKKTPRFRESEPETFSPPRPTRSQHIDFSDDGVGFATGVPAEGCTVKSPGDKNDDWSPLPPDMILAAWHAALKVTGALSPGVTVKLIFVKATLYHEVERIEAVFIRLLKLSATKQPDDLITFDLTKAPELRESDRMKRGQRGKLEAKTSLPPPGEVTLSDVTFAEHERLLKLEGRVEELESQLKVALLPVKEQLTNFAQIRTAAHICGVSHGTIHNAIKDGKLIKYELGGNCPVVNLLECRALWLNGARMGRPPKE